MVRLFLKIPQMKTFAHTLRESHGAVRGLTALLALLLTTGSGMNSYANPSGGVVVHGGIEIDGLNPAHLKILQSTDKAIINWQDFSIGQGEITQFIQPGKGSVALNRVVSGNPTSIFGQLKANGGLMVINPNGILVGASGVVDVGGMLTMSTLDIDDNDFLNGGNDRFRGNTSAGVTNFGTITSTGGDVVLLGNFIDNQGTIGAPDGTVALGAGGDIMVNQSGDAKISILGAGPGGSKGVNNSGTISGANVELKAHGNVYALAINNTGIIRATGSARLPNGRVVLQSTGGKISTTGEISARNADGSGGAIMIDAGDGEAEVGGKVDANGDGNKPGGTVDVLGRDIQVLDGAAITANGGTGGRVTIGNGATQNVNVGNGAVISANGSTGAGGQVNVTGSTVNVGNSILSANGATSGGSVMVTGDNVTLSPGTQINANGATAAGLTGNGGKIDIKAAASVVADGLLSANSKAGTGGSINITSPQTVVVNIGTSADVSGTTQGGNINLGGSFRGKADPTLANSQRTYVGSGASFKADASEGNAGTVVVWSDGDTIFRGDISAQATGAVGRGGLIEVSGKSNLQFMGNVTAKALSHQSGTVLFDPGDVTIGNAASTLPIASLNPILQNGTSVIIATESGDITVQDLGQTLDNRHAAIQWTNDDASLGLFASGNIFLYNHVRTSGAGSINLIAGWKGAESDFEPGGVFGGSFISDGLDDPGNERVFDLNSLALDVEDVWSYYLENAQFGNNGSIFMGDATLNRHIEVGSRYGNTNVAATNLLMTSYQLDGGESDWVQLGFHDSGAVFTVRNLLAVPRRVDIIANGDDVYSDGATVLQNNAPLVGVAGQFEVDVDGDGIVDGVQGINWSGAVEGTYIPYANSYNNERAGNWWWQRIEAVGSAEATGGLGANRPEYGAGQSDTSRADINVALTGALLMTSGGRANDAVQIGHGGVASNWGDDRTLRNSVQVTGVNSYTYNGASNDRVAHSIARLAPVYGNINILAGVDPNTVTYNKGLAEHNISGTTSSLGGIVKLEAWQNIRSANNLTNPNPSSAAGSSEDYVQIGHLGTGQAGEVHGNIQVQAGGDITLLGGAFTRSAATIGHTMNGFAYWNATSEPDAQVRLFADAFDFDNPQLRYGELFSDGAGGPGRGVYPANFDPISGTFDNRVPGLIGAGVYEVDFSSTYALVTVNGFSGSNESGNQTDPSKTVQVKALGGMVRKDIVGNITVDSYGNNGIVMRAGTTPDLRDGQPDGADTNGDGKSYTDINNDGLFQMAVYDDALGTITGTAFGLISGDLPDRDLNRDGFPDQINGYGSGAGDTADPTRRVREGNSGADGIGYNLDRRYVQIGHGGSGFGVDQVDGGEDFQLRITDGNEVNTGTEELIRSAGAAVNRVPTGVNLIGDISVNAHNGGVSVTAGNNTYDFAIIGHGGNEVADMETSSVAIGNITVTAKKDLLLSGSQVPFTGADNIESRSPAIIGHGGHVTNLLYRAGDITIDVGGQVHLMSGLERNNYAMVGHGGSFSYSQVGGDFSRTESLSGYLLRQRVDIPLSATVSATQVDLTFDGITKSYAINGNTANITVNAGGDILMDHGPAADRFYANRGGVGAGGSDFGGEFNPGGRGADRAQYAWTQIGHGGWGNDFILTSVTGNTTANYADKIGNIEVNSGGDITMRNGDGQWFQTAIGHRDQDANARQGDPRYIIFAGTISVSAVGDITLDASYANPNDQNVGDSGFGTPVGINPVAIGHGGAFDMYNFVIVDKDYNGALATVNGLTMDSDITVAAGGDVTLLGGRGYRASHAQIGHGYPSDAGNDQANAGGAGVAFAVGFNGDIDVYAGHDINLIAGTNPWVASQILGGAVEYVHDAFAIIGNGGAMMETKSNGDITVQAGNDLLIRAMQRTNTGADPAATKAYGPANNIAKIGHFATELRGLAPSNDVVNVNQTGNITVVVGHDLTMEGGTAQGASQPNQLAYAQIGLGGAGVDGILSGDISVFVGNDLVTKDGTTIAGTATKNNYVMIGNGDWLRDGSDATTAFNPGAGARSGDIQVAVGGSATLDHTLIGHADPLVQNGLTTIADGNTYLGVGRNYPFHTGTATLTALNGSVFSSAFYGFGSELRIYMPQRESNKISTSTRINEGVSTYAGVDGGGVSFADGLNTFDATRLATSGDPDEVYLQPDLWWKDTTDLPQFLTASIGTDGFLDLAATTDVAGPITKVNAPGGEANLASVADGDFTSATAFYRSANGVSGVGNYTIYYDAIQPVLPPVVVAPVVPVVPGEVLPIVPEIPEVIEPEIPIDFFSFLQDDMWDSWERNDLILEEMPASLEANRTLEEGESETEEEEAAKKKNRYRRHYGNYGVYYQYDLNSSQYGSLRLFGVPTGKPVGTATVE